MGKGSAYRRVHRTTCSPEGGCSLFQRCISLEAQKQWTGLAKDKDKPSTKEIIRLKRGAETPLRGKTQFLPRTAGNERLGGGKSGSAAVWGRVVGTHLKKVYCGGVTDMD